MPKSTSIPNLRDLSFQLIRKKRLLQKYPISKSTLHQKLNPNSPYFDPSFPRPIYFPGSRIPFWNEAAVDAWIAASVDQQLTPPNISAAPSLPQEVKLQTVHKQLSESGSPHGVRPIRRPNRRLLQPDNTVESLMATSGTGISTPSDNGRAS